MARIKAVFLDAGGTLFKPHPSVGAIYSEVAGRHGLTADPLLLEERFGICWKKKDGLGSLSDSTGPQQEKSWWRSLVEEVFSEFGRFGHFDSFFEELYDRFAHGHSWRLFPDVLPLLLELKKSGKTVGIVSNWDSRLFGICEELGIAAHADFILASAVVGAAKPHPKIFREALQKANVPPEEAVHVGDSYKDDVLGAEAVGIRAVLIDRSLGPARHPSSISSLQFLLSKAES